MAFSEKSWSPPDNYLMSEYVWVYVKYEHVGQNLKILCIRKQNVLEVFISSLSIVIAPSGRYVTFLVIL